MSEDEDDDGEDVSPLDRLVSLYYHSPAAVDEDDLEVEDDAE